MVADLSDDQLAVRLDAAVHLSGAELYLDRYPAAEAHAERALAVGLATGQSELVPLAYSILGQVKLLRGRLSRSRRPARQRRRGRATVRQRSGARREPGQPITDRRRPRATSTWP